MSNGQSKSEYNFGTPCIHVLYAHISYTHTCYICAICYLYIYVIYSCMLHVHMCYIQMLYIYVLFAYISYAIYVYILNEAHSLIYANQYVASSPACLPLTFLAYSFCVHAQILTTPKQLHISSRFIAGKSIVHCLHTGYCGYIGIYRSAYKTFVIYVILCIFRIYIYLYKYDIEDIVHIQNSVCIYDVMYI